ncbi:YaeQ family protein [Vibrio algarum]|uniref:YaeQ family protein n=1 Tax=Vibrio algarum TaxID=3020714 RepID=A0ABT4YVI6_9VIBR|nr:YaeQ family protein [Vibrio sp. KJ40-1]MDB1125385.1 YaeQ family protein [Vibrio sp. KJ40-1]
MALKPTIYKFRIALTDMNRDYYDSLSLTIAQHPSENLTRMMARVLAFSMNAQPDLAFTKGLSNIEEPDIWHKTLDEQISLWIDVGEPDPERVKKSTRLARNVRIYSFNTKSDVWWKQNSNKLNLLKAQVYRLDAEAIETLATYVKRTMDISIMLTGNSAFVSTENGDCEVEWVELKA